MLNEDILLQELKKDFDKTLDKVDEKINTDVYDILPCYIKKKLILKITKEELEGGIYDKSDDWVGLNFHKHLKMSDEKKYYIKFFNKEFFLYTYYCSYGIRFSCRDSLGMIDIYPDAYYDIELNDMVMDKEYFEIDLNEEYANIKTDLEIYEITEVKKIDTGILLDEIVLNDGNNNGVYINSRYIGMNNCFRSDRDEDYIYFNKPLYFSDTIYDNSNKNILTNKKYVDERINTEKITEISGLTDNASDINEWLKDETSNIRGVTNKSLFSIDNDKYNYFIKVNNKRFDLSPLPSEGEFNKVGLKIVANKEKNYILSFIIGTNVNKNYYNLEKNKMADFGITIEKLFGNSTFHLTLYRSEKQPIILNSQFIPSCAYITKSLQIGNNTDIQGFGSLSAGEGSLALGRNSVSIGENLVASSDNQFVSGKFNKEDLENKYAHIVGGGEKNLEYNIYTLDWDGNGWYRGKLSQRKEPTEDEDLTTKKYVDSKIPQMSFNSNGELVITINGVTKTFVPKSE